MSTEALADVIVTWAFDMDQKYDLGFTNSPDMHPGKPYIADFTMDLDALVERIVAARVAEALAPIRKLHPPVYEQGTVRRICGYCLTRYPCATTNALSAPEATP
jgi:hypothetical protein